MSELSCKVESGIAKISLNRPTFRNAINQAVIHGLDQSIRDLSQRTDLRAVLVSGTGSDAFCSGGDLKWLTALRDPADGAKMASQMQRVLTELSLLPVPIVAVLNGYALGGGAELALACDFRVFERHAYMSFKQSQVGLTTGWSGGWRLVDLIGYSRALQLAMTGEKISAEHAFELGLCNGIAETGNGLQIALELISQFNSAAPKANAATKRLFQDARRSTLADNMRMENQLFETLWGGPDHLEALQAFKEKRRPNFTA